MTNPPTLLILAAAHSGRAPERAAARGNYISISQNNESRTTREKIYERMFEREDREAKQDQKNREIRKTVALALLTSGEICLVL